MIESCIVFKRELVCKISKKYRAEVPQILIPKFFLDRDDEYRRSELRKTLEEKFKLLGTHVDKI